MPQFLATMMDVYLIDGTAASIVWQRRRSYSLLPRKDCRVPSFILPLETFFSIHEFHPSVQITTYFTQAEHFFYVKYY